MSWFKRKCGFAEEKDKGDIEKTEVNLVDVFEVKTPPTEVLVNGQKTELNVGDVIYIGPQGEGFTLTVGGIMVGAKGRVSYLCEQSCDGDTKTDLLTIEELQRLQLRNMIV